MSREETGAPPATSERDPELEGLGRKDPQFKRRGGGLQWGLFRGRGNISGNPAKEEI